MKVELLTDAHEHAGEPCRLGQKLEVSRSTGEWMIAQGIAKAVKSTKDKEKHDGNE